MSLVQSHQLLAKDKLYSRKTIEYTHSDSIPGVEQGNNDMVGGGGGGGGEGGERGGGGGGEGGEKLGKNAEVLL